MNNISTINLPVSTFGNVDDILVNASGSAGRIKKVDFLGAMNDWSNITNKPFDAFNNTYFRTTERSDGADILTLSDSVIAYFDKTDTLQADFAELDTKVDENYASLNAQITNSINSVSSYFGGQLGGVASRVTTLESSSHTHNNKSVIDLFSTSNSKLLWNGITVGSDYELPVATTSILGGVKPDGNTITVDDDGTIHGASQGLDFNALSTAMTTGTQSGISITADTENSRFDFEVTGIPSIAIDSEGYWTVNGERGENPTKAQGEKGNDGISPTASVEQTDTGCTVTTTDANGTTTANLTNGVNGTDGITPHVDETTKHWFIGDIDTGITAEGVTTVSTTSLTYTGTLSIDSWVGDTAPYTQTVSISGITADIEPIIDLVVSDDITTGIEELTQWSYVTKATTEDNAIMFSCYKTKPSIELNFKVKVV